MSVQQFCAFCYRWNFFNTKSGGQDKQFPPLLLTHQAVSTDKTNTVVAVSTVSHVLSLSLSLSLRDKTVRSRRTTCSMHGSE